MRPIVLTIAIVFAVPALPAPACAGLYYSGENYAELPSQWRGFLLDQRALRTIAVRPNGGAGAGPIRKRYQAEMEKLTKLAQARRLTADEAADLGALHLRLGDTARAIEILRIAQKDNPKHFHLAANLGTAWQMQGDLAQAAACLEQAANLAPAKNQKAEQLHRKLVRLRARQSRNAADLDDLFGIGYVGPSGKFEAGRLAEVQRKRLPDDAIALVQQLALWLPADGRLLWQLGELAGANGDVATAAAILDGCVTEFGLRSAQLREHRRAFRAAADGPTRSVATRGQRGDDTKSQHEGHPGLFKPRSQRPLARKLDQTPLPPIDPKGVNVLPWSVVTETTLDRQYHPTFPRYLKDLGGKKVTLEGYLQPLGDDAELNAFLLVEYPIGCWYCEQPETTAILLVELPEGKTHPYTRSQVRVRGKLILNASDPENFLYTIRGAEVRQAEPRP
jgi:tetratricopeptide (TPR) repeat protein